MIRQELLKEIYNVLDQNYFNKTDFIIKSENGNSQTTTLNIQYKYDEKYYFNIEISKTKHKIKSKYEYSSEEDFYIQGNISPGEISTCEAISFYGKYYLIDNIRKWTNLLWDELKSIPTNRIVLEQQDELNKFEEQLNSIQDELLTNEEINDFENKLNDLENKFSEYLKNEIKDKEELKKQLEKLNKEIELLKVTLHSTSKKKWFFAFGSKFITWSLKPENRELIKESCNIIKPLLPESLRAILPNSDN